MASSYNVLSKLNNKVHIPVQAKLFKKLAKLYVGQSRAVLNTGELMKIYNQQAMKYYKQEFEPMMEMYKFRQSQNDAVNSQEKNLLDRKENLFKNKKDCAEWGYQGSVEELVGRSHKLYSDRSMAFPFMFTEETIKLQESKERINFFTNQLAEEIKRVGRDNGELLVQHFQVKSQMQVEYLDQQREIWQEFNNFFDQDLDGFVTEEDDEDALNLEGEDNKTWSHLDDTSKTEANPLMAGTDIQLH